jgi:hypothetical protein
MSRIIEAAGFKAAVRRIAAACNAHGKLARGSAATEEYGQLGCKVLNLPGNVGKSGICPAGAAHVRITGKSMVWKTPALCVTLRPR